MVFRKSVVQAARDIADAVAGYDRDAFDKAMRALESRAGGAKPAERQEAVRVLIALVPALPLRLGAPVAVSVGALAGDGTDPLEPLPVLVEQAASAMELAKGLVEAYERLGVGPSEDDGAAAIERLTRERDRLGLTEEEAYKLAEAFHTGDDCLQPVLYLCQRKEVRLALPQRERLTRAIEPMTDHIETAHWLNGLLHVLDDEALVVLHRETGQGFRLRISGIGNNIQLHLLLAARLIGGIPGSPLSKAELAAATDGEMMPRNGVSGRFTMVDAFGQRIPDDGWPYDIPEFDGVRLVVLDPLPHQRFWSAGRTYPKMSPQATVEERLSAEEAGALLSRVAPAAPLGEDEAVLTDDLNLPLSGRGYGELVDSIIGGLLAGRDHEALTREVSVEFGLSLEDAGLALDRTCGGLVRAATGNPANQPQRDKDPVAWESYQRGSADPTIIKRWRPDES